MNRNQKMRNGLFLLFIFLAGSALAKKVEIFGGGPLKSGPHLCGTPEPSTERALKTQAELDAQKKAACEADPEGFLCNLDIRKRNGLFEIPLSFFIVYHPDTNEGNLNDTIIAEQVDVINSLYSTSGMPYHFYIESITRIGDKILFYYDLYNDFPNKYLIYSQKEGGIFLPQSLPIISNGPFTGFSGGGTLLGFCYFPDYYPETSWKHGCVNDYRTFPGGILAEPIKGIAGTVPHEIGHGVGLHHPFAYGCDEQYHGDFVLDTNLQEAPIYSCPGPQDPEGSTCDDGYDPIDNVMGYSSCPATFTPGQAERSLQMMAYYRPIMMGLAPYVPKNDSDVYEYATCNTMLYDFGGPMEAYPPNGEVAKTICAPEGQNLTLSFVSFNIENGDVACEYDSLTIFDGKTASTENQIYAGSKYSGGLYCGFFTPPQVTSTNEDGCLTLYFSSDGFVENPGFSAFISCEDRPLPSGSTPEIPEPQLMERIEIHAATVYYFASTKYIYLTRFAEDEIFDVTDKPESGLVLIHANEPASAKPVKDGDEVLIVAPFDDLCVERVFGDSFQFTDVVTQCTKFIVSEPEKGYLTFQIKGTSKCLRSDLNKLFAGNCAAGPSAFFALPCDKAGCVPETLGEYVPTTTYSFTVASPEDVLLVASIPECNIPVSVPFISGGSLEECPWIGCQNDLFCGTFEDFKTSFGKNWIIQIFNDDETCTTPNGFAAFPTQVCFENGPGASLFYTCEATAAIQTVYGNEGCIEDGTSESFSINLGCLNQITESLFLDCDSEPQPPTK